MHKQIKKTVKLEPPAVGVEETTVDEVAHDQHDECIVKTLMNNDVEQNHSLVSKKVWF